MNVEAIGLSRGQLVALLTSLVAVGAIATNMYTPTLPAITVDFGTTSATAQLTLTSYFAGIAFTQLFYGPLSDRFGRRPVLFGGLALFAGASILCAVAQSVEGLIAARFFQAAGACVGPVVSRAVVRDLFNREQTASMMASITFAIAIAPATAPLIGAYVYAWAGWRMNFAIVAAFGLLIMLIAWWRLPETLPEDQPALGGLSGIAAIYRRLLASPAYLGYALSSMFVLATLFAFVSEAPYIVINMIGLSEQAYGWYGLITVGGFALGSFTAGRITPRIGIDRTIVLGVAIVLSGGLLLAGLAQFAALSIASIIGPMVVVVLGMGLVFPNATAGALSVHPEFAGSASALLGFLQMVGAGVAVVIVGQISDGTHVPMTLAVAAFSFSSALSFGLAKLAQRAS